MKKVIRRIKDSKVTYVDNLLSEFLRLIYGEVIRYIQQKKFSKFGYSAVVNIAKKLMQENIKTFWKSPTTQGIQKC